MLSTHRIPKREHRALIFLCALCQRAQGVRCRGSYQCDLKFSSALWIAAVKRGATLWHYSGLFAPISGGLGSERILCGGIEVGGCGVLALSC